jgi:hypothetical protein
MTSKGYIYIIATCIITIGIIAICVADYVKKQNADKQLYEYVKSENTLAACEKYFEKYNNEGNYTSEIRTLHENILWKQAESTQSYTNYLNKYPYGTYAEKAKETMKKIETAKWNEARKKNTITEYKKYLESYPHGIYATEAIEKIETAKWNTEPKAWSEARNRNTATAYKKYLDLYPYGANAQRAKKLIIDREVDAIFGSSYGKLPAMEKRSYGYGNYSTIHIYNNTSYTLTIRYSGTDSKQVSILPRQRQTVSLQNGSYRIAASVDAANVKNFAGTETLSGGIYDIQYYITTSIY